MGKPRTKEVVMFWIEEDQKWHMNDAEHDVFMYPFYNCLYVKGMYENLTKNNRRKYRITIEDLGEVE